MTDTDDVVNRLMAAASLSTDEVEHKLLVHCYQVLTGQATVACVPTLVLAHAKQASNEADLRRRLAAYQVLIGQDSEALKSLQSAQYAREHQAYQMPVRKAA